MEIARIRPFAIELYYKWRDGKTIDELVRETSIPKDRVVQRIRVAQTLQEGLRHANRQP